MLQPRTFDFSKVKDKTQHPVGKPQDDDTRPVTADGKLLTPKQIRARARRKRARNEHMSSQEMDFLYRKPVEEWDLEELAHGRPRNKQGHFKGPAPTWIDRSIHERAMEKYKAAVKSNMQATTVDALNLLQELLNNSDVDEKGKPIVPYSTKLDASKFLIEHVIGKPTQRIENDVSVQLQAILGTVMINPDQLGAGYTPAHYPGLTMDLGPGFNEDEDEELGE